jgi:transcriptional regulator with XRE-family HTH domain
MVHLPYTISVVLDGGQTLIDFIAGFGTMAQRESALLLSHSVHRMHHHDVGNYYMPVGKLSNFFAELMKYRIRVRGKPESYRSFAKRLGISQAMLTRYKQGTVPRAEILYRISDNLGLNPAQRRNLWRAAGGKESQDYEEAESSFQEQVRNALTAIFPGPWSLTDEQDAAEQDILDTATEKILDAFEAVVQPMAEERDDLRRQLESVRQTLDYELRSPDDAPDYFHLQTEEQRQAVRGIVAGSAGSRRDTPRLIEIPKAAPVLTAQGILKTDRSGETRHFPEDWLRDHASAVSRLILVTVNDNGMSPTLECGDLVLVDQGDTTRVRSGSVYAVAQKHPDKTVRIRRLEICPQTGEIRIGCDNRSVNDAGAAQVSIERESGADITIIGRVIWLSREL